MKKVLFCCHGNDLVALETIIVLINALKVTFIKATMFFIIKNCQNEFSCEQNIFTKLLNISVAIYPMINLEKTFFLKIKDMT